MTDPNAANTFRLLIEKVFSRTDKFKQIRSFAEYTSLFADEYNKILNIISKVRDSDTLSELMNIYLERYVNYYSNKDNIHFYRSDQTFKELIRQTVKTSIKTRDLFEEWQQNITGVLTYHNATFRDRFDELNKTDKSQIIYFIEEEKNKRRKIKSILNYLKDEFIKQNGIEKFEGAEQLYDFNPYPDEALKSAFDTQMNKVLNAWNTASKPQNVNQFKNNIEIFNKTLEGFQEYLSKVPQGDILRLFQIIKYLQDLVRLKRIPMQHGQTKLIPSGANEAIYELYAMACVQLLVFASAKALLLRNRYSFAEDEMKYFLNPIRNYYYVSNIEIKFSISLKNIPSSFDASKMFLNMILLTKNQLSFATLENMKETLSVQFKWQQIRNLVQEFKLAGNDVAAQLTVLLKNIPAVETFTEIAMSKVDLTGSGPELSKGVITVGDWPGDWPGNHGNVRVVYILPDNQNVYIEFESLKPFLFKVNKSYLKEKLYGTRIFYIYESTRGMLYISEMYFLMMGFLPVFVEAGFGGLIVEIIYYLASTKIEELVSTYNQYVGKILGLLVSVLGPRRNFKPDVKVPSKGDHVNTYHVFTVEKPPRRLAEIIESRKKSEKLLGDVNQSATSSVVELIKSSARSLFPQEVFEFLGSPISSEALALHAATPEGYTMRISDQATSSKGTGLGSRSVSRQLSEVRLSKALKNELSKLEEYYGKLTSEELILTKKEVRGILQDLIRGVSTPDRALKDIRNLLNDAREVTGELVADGFVHSNFKVLKVYDIPKRVGGVPILDRVYKVQDLRTGKLDLLWVEVKGGERTNLGYVTRKIYDPKSWRLIGVKPDQFVKQGSGEWYFQKIIELYQGGHKKLAKELFQAAVNGNVQSAIVKSGIEMAPNFYFNSFDIIQWFRGKEMPTFLNL